MGLSERSRGKRLQFWVGGTVTGLVVALVAVTLVKVPREMLRLRAQNVPASSADREGIEHSIETPVERVEIKNAIARKIVATAHKQEGDEYDASYRRISYPNGDVPKGSGACTDVVVRSLRGAGIDLQALVHEDMKRNFGRYSDQWGLGRTDSNIDHRRVPNLMVFFQKHGKSLPLGTSGTDLSTWQPGDIVCWRLNDNRWHTGVISDGVGLRGLPLVVHNGWQCVEQDALDGWKIVGHFRYPRQQIS